MVQEPVFNAFAAAANNAYEAVRQMANKVREATTGVASKIFTGSRVANAQNQANYQSFLQTQGAVGAPAGVQNGSMGNGNVSRLNWSHTNAGIPDRYMNPSTGPEVSFGYRPEKPYEAEGFFTGVIEPTFKNLANDFFAGGNQALAFVTSPLIPVGNFLDEYAGVMISVETGLGHYGKPVQGVTMGLKYLGRGMSWVGKAGTSLSRTQYERGFVREFTSDVDKMYYRVYSGGHRTEGSWLSSVKPNSSEYAQDAFSLPGFNEATHYQRVFVPAGTNLRRSRAGGFDAHDIFPNRRGGGEQFRLMDGPLPDEYYGPGRKLN
ncbi:MAG: hypothetical protein KDI92_12515 [Xanthomonadales bacterium]|nr:hypothetical protein [Xanthomonadales bacterium]